MVRLVNIYLPTDKANLTLPKIESLSKTYVYQVTVNYFSSQCLISFKAKDKHLQYVLEGIQSTGCGVQFGHIDVLSVILSKPPVVDPFAEELSAQKKKRAYRISDRMTIDEIAAFVDDGNHLTFNFIAQLAMASLIAGAGLLGNSATTVIASMLVSPLMGPILSITFGLSIGDKRTIRKGVRNELVGIAISLITGLIMGFFASLYYHPDYRSDEMVNRGEASGLFYGFIVATASGVAVVVAISMGGLNAIVGTAISASLLPPIVNAGLCLAMAIKFRLANKSYDDAQDYAEYGAVSPVDKLPAGLAAYSQTTNTLHGSSSVDSVNDGSSPSGMVAMGNLRNELLNV
eukprot:scaffold1083_cov165-Ochromonas_danica.AAC.2